MDTQDFSVPSHEEEDTIDNRRMLKVYYVPKKCVGHPPKIVYPQLACREAMKSLKLSFRYQSSCSIRMGGGGILQDRSRLGIMFGMIFIFFFLKPQGGFQSFSGSSDIRSQFLLSRYASKIKKFLIDVDVTKMLVY